MLIRRALLSLVHRAGYEVFSRKWLPGADIPEFETMLSRVDDSTMVARDGLFSLYLLALECEARGLAGSFVECGVWKGGAVGLMAQVNLAHGRERRPLHLFDAFGDICEPDASVDGPVAVAQARKWSPSSALDGGLRPMTGFYDHRGGPGSVEGNRALLVDRIGYDASFVHFHRGWFQDTLPACQGRLGPIALLRLDGDWHASTKVCLDHLYDLVVPGGFVILDDYGAYEGCRRAVDEFMAARGLRPHLHFVNRDVRYLVKA